LIKNNKKKIIFDATVLVSGQVSGDIYKTGLYRVSYETLIIFCQLNLYEIFLFDVYYRERELNKIVSEEFPGCIVLKVYSSWYRIFIFPVSNLIDKLRLFEQKRQRDLLRTLAWMFKNILIFLEKVAKKTDKTFFHERNLKREIAKCDLYYSTYFPIPHIIRSDTGIKKVYTIHDMIPIINPEYFSSPYNKYILKEVVDNIKSEDYVICVSESTKRDLLRYRHNLEEKKIIVSYPAASDKFYKVIDLIKIEQIKCRYKINCEKYILSVCTIEPRKNLLILIKAYKNILIKIPDFKLKLVLIGSYGWSSDQLIKDIEEVNSNYHTPIILTGFIPDQDLAVLYSGAYMFVYPSLYEGFGLPVLEAMQCGIPVITSNKSSLPEVVGDSGILFDPSDNIALENAIQNLLNNPALRQSMAEKAVRRALKFNWGKTSKTIVDTLDLAIL
jgi:glycosyltransferase involved in cell wall biosynthesis